MNTLTAADPASLDRARAIVQRAHAISPSASLLRLEASLRDGNTTARQLARLIEGSPALAARVLRMANSAFYAPAQPVTTLSRAVALLGDTVLRQLVLTSLIVSRRAGTRTPLQALAARLAGDAVRAAVVARNVAELMRRSGGPAIEPDLAFAAGLLHDLGHVYLLDEVGEPYASYLVGGRSALVIGSAADQLEREQALAGTTHQDVGAVFAFEWNLPPVIAQALYDHHEPASSPISALMTVADSLVREMTYGPIGASAGASDGADAPLAPVGLDRETWETRLPVVRDQAAELLTLFDEAA